MANKATATDIVLDEANRAYNLITVEYDLETKEAKIISVEPFADSKHLALYKGQQLLAKKMFGVET